MKKLKNSILFIALLALVSCTKSVDKEVIEEEFHYYTFPATPTQEIAEVSYTSASIKSNITDDGGKPVKARGVVWSVNDNPTLKSNDGQTQDGEGTGEFTSELTKLKDGQIYYVCTYATNELGTSYSESKSMQTNSRTLAEIKAFKVNLIDFEKVECSFNISADGGSDISACGVIWSTDKNPTLEKNEGQSMAEGQTGEKAITITSITKENKYYLRAFATNKTGTKYSTVEEIKIIGYPKLTQPSIQYVTYKYIIPKSNIESDGGGLISESGFVWSTKSNPTLENNEGQINETPIENKISAYASGLTDGTRYFFRAYAKNERGVAYSTEAEATTLKYAIPTVTTVAIDEIGTSFAKISGMLSDNGGLLVSNSGIVWSKTANPTIENNEGITINQRVNNKFVSLMNKLEANTTYYVRAYSTNEMGTGYGDQKTLTTYNFFEMVKVQGGTFEMGSNKTEPNELPKHTVTVNSFEIGKFEVSQAEWEYVMGTNPAGHKGSLNPIENISWNEVQEFLKKLNEKTGKNYRLPTEAEWEFAANGGNQSNGYNYAGSNTIDEVAWYQYNSNQNTHKRGGKNANELGIYDMTGNVWEMCSDWYNESYYKESTPNNPQGPSTGEKKTIRGGSCRSFPLETHITRRFYINPNSKYTIIGFRVVRTL